MNKKKKREREFIDRQREVRSVTVTMTMIVILIATVIVTMTDLPLQIFRKFSMCFTDIFIGLYYMGIFCKIKVEIS